jgi:hypothetical protein
MLKFSVQTFYQPLFSNSPLAILLQQFFFLPKTSHTKKKPQTKIKRQRQKTPSSFRGSLIPSGKQGGAAVLGEGPDIVTGETCVPAALK